MAATLFPLYRPRDGRSPLAHDGQPVPFARLILSLYDLEARYTTKRDTLWVGYKVHLTETCANGQPHLIT